MNKALLLVDLQNDFCPGGSLAVNEGDLTINVANQAIIYFKATGQTVIATKDWHPAHHKSFASQSHKIVGDIGELHGQPQVWWPDHCVQHSHGAAFHQALNDRAIDKIIYKGQNPDIDSYSAFFDNGRLQETELRDWLSQNGVNHLTIMGLATDYCVKYTVLDALSLGYSVDILLDGCRGVNLAPGDSEKALAEMAAAGAKPIDLHQLHSLS